MAYLPDEQNAQNQNSPANGQPNSMASQAPITSSPAPTSGGASAGKTLNQATNNGPSQPFTNLQTYLSANAPQIQAQGDTIAGNLNNQYGSTVGAVDKAATDFGASVNSGYAQNNPTVVNNFTQDPTSVANDPNQAAAFSGMYNDEYTGPSSFESSAQYGAANDAVNRAQTAAAQLTSPQGVSSYLMGQNPNESQGMATLDSSLLQGNPGVVQTIQDAATPFQNLPSYLIGKVAAGDQSVADATAQAAAAKAAAQGAFSDTSGKFNTQVGNEFSSALDSAKGFNQNYNDIIARLSGTMPVGTGNGIQQLTPDEQAALGISNDALGQYTNANQDLQSYNSAPDSFKFGEGAFNSLNPAGPVSLSNYLTGGNTEALPQDVSSIATPQEYAEAAALSKLGGAAYTSPLDQANIGQAGTYKPNGNYQTFDQTKANNDLINPVTTRDKAVANQLFANEDGVVNGSFAGVKPGDYAGALAALQKDMAANPNGNPTIEYEMNALNRLANGFTAPPAGYTPTPGPTPPTIGGGIDPNPPTPPPSGGPGRVTR